MRVISRAYNALRREFRSEAPDGTIKDNFVVLVKDAQNEHEFIGMADYSTMSHLIASGTEAFAKYLDKEVPHPYSRELLRATVQLTFTYLEEITKKYKLDTKIQIVRNL